MAVNILRRAAITLAVYIAALLGILILQFSGSNEFTLTSGALKISGSERPDAAGEKVPEAPLFVSADGITFFIDRRSPLTAVLDTGEEVPLEMQSYIKEENSFTVRFNRNVSISFFSAEAGDDGESASVAAIDAFIPEGVAFVSLAYALDPRASVESAEGELVVGTESGYYKLEGAEPIDLEAERASSDELRLAISASNPSLSYVRIKYEILEEVSLASIAQDPSAAEDVHRQVAENLAETVIQAYQAAAASDSVTESLAAAFLAESARRGNLDEARRLIPASFLNSSARSYNTSPFIGGVDAAWSKWLADCERELAAYTSNLDARNPAIFEKKDLVAFLISNRRADDYRRLADFADQCARHGNLTPRQAAGIIEFSMDRSLLPRSVPGVSNATIAACEETLLKSLRYFSSRTSASSALYIEESFGNSITMSALEIASILYQWGTANREKSDWAAAARLVFATALRLAGSDAALPAAIAIPDSSGKSDSSSSGGGEAAAIPLADIYPLIEPLATWYPRAVAVYPRYCIWTSAPDATLDFPRAGLLDMTIDFPAGQSYYVVVRGVQDFYGIQVNGTTYNSDSSFEESSSTACRYVTGADTLFIKMQQRTGRETVRIFYRNPNQ